MERCTNPTALLDAMRAATPSDSTYAVNEENLTRLEELAAYCKEKGIELTFVLPPIDSALRELLVEPLGIDEPLGEVKKRLKQPVLPCLILNMSPSKLLRRNSTMTGCT